MQFLGGKRKTIESMAEKPENFFFPKQKKVIEKKSEWEKRGG